MVVLNAVNGREHVLVYRPRAHDLPKVVRCALLRSRQLFEAVSTEMEIVTALVVAVASAAAAAAAAAGLRVTAQLMA